MLHSSIILSGESYTFEDQDKSIVRCFIKQRTCLFSLERWPHLEIFQHKTILVACKKIQLLIYNTKRYKVITIQVFTKKKKHGIIHLSQRKQTCKEFFVQCIFFNSQKRQVSKTRNIHWNQLLEHILTLFFLHVLLISYVVTMAM